MSKKASMSTSKKNESSNGTRDQSKALLLMGNINITFKIEFSDKDLEISKENEEGDNEIKEYYNINDFQTIKDLEFLKNKKEVWDKFELIPNNNTTLKYLFLANAIREKKTHIDYIGFGRPSFTNDEEFFEEIFNHVAKKYNIIFKKTPLNTGIESIVKFEFKHKNYYNNFECIRYGEESDNNDETNNKNKKTIRPVFSREGCFFEKMELEHTNYYLFYINYEELNNFQNDFQRKDLIELLYFFKKRGIKTFVNFYKKEPEENVEEKEEDNIITKEHFVSSSMNYIETEVEYFDQEDEFLDTDSKAKKMLDTNNIYYLSDFYFFDVKYAASLFDTHYQHFTSDKIKSKVNKGNLYDYFIKGIATGTKDAVENEKIGLFMEYFNKLYIIKVQKDSGNKYGLDLKVHPQINHFNQERINQYKKIIKKNKNYYIGLLTAYILGAIAENNSTNIDTLFKGYASGLEVIKKKLEIEKNNIDIDIDNEKFIKIKLPEKELNVKVKSLEYCGKENGFILDCTNKKESEMKQYVPLYDRHMSNFLKSSYNIKELYKKGFIDKNGYIMMDPYYKNIMKDDEQVQEEKKTEFNNRLKNEIKSINVLKRLSDKIKNTEKEAKNINRPTKKLVPNQNSTVGLLYRIASQSNKTKKKPKKNY